MSHNITGSTLFRNLRTRVDITVATIADRDALLTYRRRWGMVVAVYDDGVNNGHYTLRKGESSDILGDNNNWVFWKTQLITMVETPPSPTEAGGLLDIVVCDDFLYICIQAGGVGAAKWKRAPLRNYQTI